MKGKATYGKMQKNKANQASTDFFNERILVNSFEKNFNKLKGL